MVPHIENYMYHTVFVPAVQCCTCTVTVMQACGFSHSGRPIIGGCVADPHPTTAACHVQYVPKYLSHSISCRPCNFELRHHSFNFNTHAIQHTYATTIYDQLEIRKSSIAATIPSKGRLFHPRGAKLNHQRLRPKPKP